MFKTRLISGIILVIVLIATVGSVSYTHLFIAEREELIVLSKKIAPDPLVRRMTLVMDNLKYAVGGYFRAQFKICLLYTSRCV